MNKRDPTTDIELPRKKHIDDSIGDGTILRFIQTCQNLLKVSIRDDVYILTNWDRIQITDTTIIKYPNQGGYLLQQWNIKCKNWKNNGKTQNFIKSTKTNSPMGNSGGTCLPPTVDSFM